MTFDPDSDPEFRAQTRRNLLEEGIPEELVDDLLILASEYGKKAAEAVENFERRGGEVIYTAILAAAPEVYLKDPWEEVSEEVHKVFIDAFSAAVDFIDEETYDPEN